MFSMQIFQNTLIHSRHIVAAAALSTTIMTMPEQAFADWMDMISPGDFPATLDSVTWSGGVSLSASSDSTLNGWTVTFAGKQPRATFESYGEMERVSIEPLKCSHPSYGRKNCNFMFMIRGGSGCFIMRDVTMKERRDFEHAGMSRTSAPIPCPDQINLR